MARVDILLPYWGDFELLRKTVESVLAQTEQDWRLMVFDDCYPSDEAPKYFNTLKDSRVSYFRHTKNIGIANNFNYAIDSATAKYCVMPGCDDILLPNYLEKALKNIGKADFYQPGVDVIDEDGAVYLPLTDRVKRLLRPKASRIHGGEKLASSLCHGNWLYFPSIMWKTDAINKRGFDTRYKIAEDLVLELGIIKDGGTLYLDSATTFHYRRFAKSLSSVEKSKGGVRFGEEDEVYEHFANEFQKLGWKRAARAAKLRITSRLHRLLS